VPLHFLDASDGTIIKTFYAITEEEEALGYGGAGIWATAVVDLDEKYLYAGTADSEAFKRQHPRNQAIVKIDADRNRSTFGTIVDAYSGVPERYVDPLVPGLEKNPLCEMFGGPDDPLAGTSPSSSNSCLELDLDFGASPSFFIDDEGNKLIAELQKAGVFHVVRADTMQPQWVRILSAPMALGNATTAAYDGNDLFVAANPNSMFSFEKTFGFPNWLSSTASDAARFQPMTVANGVLYTQNNAGSLIAVDAATGLTLLNRPVTVDADGAPCVSLGGGVAVARNTVYAQCDTSGWVVAYRPQASPMP
jgi:outer membrane protein assembly factor BamB